MDPLQNSTKGVFFKTHILPVLLIFLIPGFSAWFFSFAETKLDREVLEVVETDIRDKSQLPAAEKARVAEFYHRVPVSRIMASSQPDLLKLQQVFAPTKTRYAIYRWMKRISWICLGTVLATLLI